MGRKTIPGLIQRDGIWHIDKRICGRRICQSTGTGDIQEAEKYLARVMEETRKATVYGVRPERTFEQASARFVLQHPHKRSLSSDIVQLKLLLPQIGKLSLHEVHLGKLQPWVELCQRSGKAVGTINHGLKIVRRILNLAASDWVDENGLTWLRAAPKIRLLPDKGKRSPYPLSWAEQDVLFASLPDYLADMALFAVNTGCRDAEICNLRWEWEVAVPQMRTSVFIIPGDRVKNGEDRLVALNDVACSVVDRCRGVHTTHVFTYRGKPIRRMLTSAWVRARQRTNLSHVRVHDLKHTFGRRLRAAGVSFEDRQDLLGHRSGRIATHYSAAELTRLIEAANRVCSASIEGQGLVVMRGALARVPQNSRSDLKEGLKRLVPRGGIEPPTP